MNHANSSEKNSNSSDDTLTYISIGTIRVRRDVVNDTTTALFFSPTTGFSVSHAGEEYVALLSTDGSPGCGILVPYDPKKGIPLNFDGDRTGLVEAAIQHCAVEIEVQIKRENAPQEYCKDMDWSLRAITIPAHDRTT